MNLSSPSFRACSQGILNSGLSSSCACAAGASVSSRRSNPCCTILKLSFRIPSPRLKGFPPAATDVYGTNVLPGHEERPAKLAGLSSMENSPSVSRRILMDFGRRRRGRGRARVGARVRAVGVGVLRALPPRYDLLLLNHRLPALQIDLRLLQRLLRAEI